MTPTKVNRTFQVLTFVVGAVLGYVVAGFIGPAAHAAQLTTGDVVASVSDTARDAVSTSRQAIADPVGDAQRSMAMAVVPALVAAQGDLALVLPAPLGTPPAQAAVSPAAVDMIVGFEILSRSYYVKRLQRPVWPGGVSGVTWGIGYDGGHQPQPRIVQDWAQHPDVARLTTTSGVIGARARPLAAQLRSVITPLAMAEDVFAQSTLPAYASLTSRTFRKGWDCIGADPQGSLVATVYNRGASMRGNSRREMRELRDDCVPRCDTGCMAAAFRSMKRVWAGTSLEVGLGRRYEATARLAEGAGA